MGWPTRYRMMLWSLLFATVGLAGSAASVLAQEPGPAGAEETGGGGTVTMFTQFFLPGDALGIGITWLLIVLSIVVIALVIHFVIQNRASIMLPEEGIAQVEAMLDERRFKEAIEHTADDDSAFGQIIHASLAEAGNGYGAMERAIEETGDLLLTRKFRPLEYLNVIGAIGPMLGLFGTVYGMIVAFDQIRKIGNVQPDDLAGGIGTALVTTFWGLIVGIPAVAGYALIRNRVDALVTEAMIESEDLISRFRPGSTRKSAAAPKPKPESTGASE